MVCSYYTPFLSPKVHTLVCVAATHLYVCYYYTPYQGVLLLHTVACVKNTHLRCVFLRNYTPFVCSSDTPFRALGRRFKMAVNWLQNRLITNNELLYTVDRKSEV